MATSRLFQVVDFPSKPFAPIGSTTAALSPGRKPAEPEMVPYCLTSSRRDPDLERSCNSDEGVGAGAGVARRTEG